MHTSSFQYRRSSSRRGAIGFAIVVALHVVLGLVLNSGLGQQFIKGLKNGPVETVLLEDFKPPPPPPPPEKKPDLPPPPPPAYVPPVDVPVAASEGANAIQAVKSAPQKQAPIIDANRNCRKPEYPAASRRDEEQGTVQLRFLVDVDGAVIDSQVTESSGFKRLDEAARQALARCQFTPGYEGGKPVQAWASMKYTWRLEFK